MRNQTLKLFFLLALLTVTSTSLQAQVTIASLSAPVNGALLDLKEQDTNGTANATKGMMLPRVNLSDPDNLYPMFASGYDTAENDKHAGLIVYNLTGNSLFCPGVYVWSGVRWKKLGTLCP